MAPRKDENSRNASIMAALRAAFLRREGRHIKAVEERAKKAFRDGKGQGKKL